MRYRGRSVLGTVATIALGAVLVVAPTPATAAGGPALHVSRAQLATALECSGPLTGLTRDPVLLTPAFTSGPGSYGFNYRRQLPVDGTTTCTLSVPGNGFEDLQTAAEYDVAAVRYLVARSGRKVALLGHQHGALDALWALTFWPDLAADVSDFISLATPYRGTDAAAAFCATVPRCPPSFWQIATGSKFLAALAARPLPAGPSYTSIATAYDELIVPQPRASTLTGATNITLQDVCPGRPIEHFTILADNLTYRLVQDALAHPGGADVSRVPPSVCTGPLYLPGVVSPGGAVGAVSGFAGFLAGFGGSLLFGSVSSEPALRSYAR